MNKFRPTDLSKKYLLKHRLKHGYNTNYNFCSRDKWYPAGWGLNKKTIGDQFSKLHYLAWHSPKPIRNKWIKVYNVFYKKHFGTHHGTMRYLNTYSCHSWL